MSEERLCRNCNLPIGEDMNVVVPEYHQDWECCVNALKQENAELRERCEKAERERDTVHKNVITFITQFTCETHNNEIKELSFADWQRSRFVQCVGCVDNKSSEALAKLSSARADAFKEAARVAREIGSDTDLTRSAVTNAWRSKLGDAIAAAIEERAKDSTSSNS